MIAVVMEGQTPPQDSRRAGRPILYPFMDLKVGEAFLVKTAGLSLVQCRKKYDNLRKRKNLLQKLHQRCFTVTPLSPEEGIRVRRDS
jgi:hypothetical protein